jgi:hypothetical protein
MADDDSNKDGGPSGNAMDGSGDNALGVSFISCSACDYDLCLHCSGDSSVTERAERANKRTPGEKELDADPLTVAQRPKARVLPSKYARSDACCK